MSSQKTLKIKRVFAWAVFNGLRNIPPKDYPTTGEIRSTLNAILPVLKEQVSSYMDMVKKAEELSVRVAAKELSDEVAQTEVEKINKEWQAYNKEHGKDDVEIVLEEEDLKTLKAQFERENWGTKWIATLEEFGELLEVFAQAGK